MVFLFYFGKPLHGPFVFKGDDLPDHQLQYFVSSFYTKLQFSSDGDSSDFPDVFVDGGKLFLGDDEMPFHSHSALDSVPHRLKQVLPGRSVAPCCICGMLVGTSQDLDLPVPKRTHENGVPSLSSIAIDSLRSEFASGFSEVLSAEDTAKTPRRLGYNATFVRKRFAFKRRTYGDMVSIYPAIFRIVYDIKYRATVVDLRIYFGSSRTPIKKVIVDVGVGYTHIFYGPPTASLDAAVSHLLDSFVIRGYQKHSYILEPRTDHPTSNSCVHYERVDNPSSKAAGYGAVLEIIDPLPGMCGKVPPGSTAGFDEEDVARGRHLPRGYFPSPDTLDL